MADLVTHLCSALLPAVLLRWRMGAVLAVGAVLPDLGSRVPTLGLEAIGRLTGAELPLALYQPFAVFHMPVGMVLSSFLLAQLFVARQRAAVFRWLLLGQGLHLALDLLQDHHGHGYLVLWPLWRQPVELGWIGSEATVPLAPVLLVLTAAAWRLRR